ncbi:hypothetical protein TWF281_004624 [Arthrobotrys megalospora]
MAEMTATKYQKADQLRLEKIDRLHAAGVADWISLPQLVVVGDQSSGKSSVLDGLTGLPFPRDSGLCTRFVTQITFRRSPIKSIHASIISTGGRELTDDEKAFKFEAQGISTLSSEQYLGILNSACEKMGVPKILNEVQEGEESFSRDVLKFEFNGPLLDHFSVLHVPGLFRRPIPGQTTTEDIHLVKHMVKRYIENPRSIILTVVPANVDIATQEVLQMAEEADPSRERTLTVFTKPDLVDAGAEKRIIDLVNGKAVGQKLGYCIVRNRSQQETGTAWSERHDKEATFFSTAPWSWIDQQRAGIPALEARIEALLIDLTRREFQNVGLELAKRLHDCERNLIALGPSLDTEAKQRRKLLELAVNFQNLASNAMDGYYTRHPAFILNQSFRLATTIVRLNEEFSEAMSKYGHSRNFNHKSPSESARVTTQAEAENAISTYNNFREEDMCYLLDTSAFTIKISKGAISEWITREYNKTRGFEIGTYSPQLLKYLFAEQSNNWEVLTRKHMKRVIHEIHFFIYHLLEEVCGDKEVTAKVFNYLRPKLLQSYTVAFNQSIMLLDVERKGTLLTLNHYFADNVMKARADRLHGKFETLNCWTAAVSEEPLLSISEVIQALGKDNAEHQRDDIHDNLKAYYKVARKRFVDAICLQAIDFYLIQDEASPLKLFNPLLVHKATAEDIQIMMGESDVIAAKREGLEAQARSLRAGRDILSQTHD